MGRGSPSQRAVGKLNRNLSLTQDPSLPLPRQLLQLSLRSQFRHRAGIDPPGIVGTPGNRRSSRTPESIPRPAVVQEISYHLPDKWSH